jgi:hypothetical protein
MRNLINFKLLVLMSSHVDVPVLWVLFEGKCHHSSLRVPCSIHQCQVMTEETVPVKNELSVSSHVQCLYEFHLFLLLCSGCSPERGFPSAAVNTRGRDSVGRATRGGLDDILPEPLNIWAFSVGHSQLWALSKWRDEQSATPNGATGLSPVDCLCQGFCYLLVSCDWCLMTVSENSRKFKQLFLSYQERNL